MWGADIWNLYGTEGLVKRTPTVTRQQRRRARQQVDMVSHTNHQFISGSSELQARTQSILFLKSMSERGESAIERL